MGRISAGAAALVLAAVLAGAAAADPVNGHNATGGTLTCGSTTYPTTSGSPAAMAIQIVGSSRVFVVKRVPDFGINRGGGIPADKLVDCWLQEDAIGPEPILISGLFVPAS